MATEIEILRQTAGMVVTALGDGWKIDPDPDSTWQVRIDGPDGEKLMLSRGDKNWRTDDVNRIGISGAYFHLIDNNDQLPYKLRRPSITVARSRGPEVIAKEITKRLLPDYRADIADVRASVTDHQDADNARAALAERIGGRKIDHKSGNTNTTVSVPGGSIRINYRADGCGVDLYSCPVEIAVKLAEMLREHEAASRAE